MAETIIVKRTGQAPLRFRGTTVASASSPLDGGYGQDVTIYRTAKGRYIVAIHNKTIWEGEHNTDEAAVFPSLNQCMDYLSNRIPGWMHTKLIEGIGEEIVEDIS